jgi:hypothetical protein
LFIDRTTTGCPFAHGRSQKLARQLTVLADDERRAPPRHPKHQPQGAKVAIFDPEIIRSDVLKHLRNQAALLGMAILIQYDIGNQHALLVQHHQGLPC